MKPNTRSFRHRRGVQRPLEERFWEKIEKTDSCWVWTGTRHRGTYGKLKVNKANLAAHRISWELHNGPVPDGMLVCHRCDNPPCCNPEHLFLGTHQDNSDDKFSKGRYRTTFRRLSKDEVVEIRRKRAAGAPLAAIAEQHGLHYDTISMIVNRRSWRDVA